MICLDRNNFFYPVRSQSRFVGTAGAQARQTSHGVNRHLSMIPLTLLVAIANGGYYVYKVVVLMRFAIKQKIAQLRAVRQVVDGELLTENSDFGFTDDSKLVLEIKPFGQRQEVQVNGLTFGRPALDSRHAQDKQPPFEGIFGCGAEEFNRQTSQAGFGSMLQSDNNNSPRFLDVKPFDVQKVSVGGKQYHSRFFGKIKNVFIGGKMKLALNGSGNLMSFGAERFNNEQGNTVVREDAHLVDGKFFGKDSGRFFGEVGSKLQSG